MSERDAASRAQLARFLNEEIDRELQKPMAEQDMALIDKYTVILCRLNAEAETKAAPDHARALRRLKRRLRPAPRRRANAILVAVLCILLTCTLSISASGDLFAQIFVEKVWAPQDFFRHVGDRIRSYRERGWSIDGWRVTVSGEKKNSPILHMSMEDYPVGIYYPYTENDEFALLDARYINKAGEENMVFKFTGDVSYLIAPGVLPDDPADARIWQPGRICVSYRTVAGRAVARFVDGGLTYQVTAPNEQVLFDFLQALYLP